MNDPLNRAAFAKLERFLLMSKSAKGAGAAKLIQDAISAPDVFVFAELLDVPNISELAQNEQQKQWIEVLRLFSYGTYTDYKANASRLPPLTPIQLTKLKYLTLVSMAKGARVLSYSSLQEALDIASIRELEDLIIEAMYQDIIHGKLDQLRQIFEIEWAMGRDLRQGEEREILEALKTWHRTTGAVLAALDKQIQKIKEKERTHTKMVEDHEKEFLDNLKEAAAKAKEAPTQNTRQRRPLGPAGSRADEMDIDDPMERSGAMDLLRGKKKDTGSARMPPLRKRTRE